MKKKFQIIKEIWSNERLRALCILGVYFVFFIFLGAILRNRPTRVVSPEPDVTQPSSKHYQYLMEIKLDQDSYTIFGSQKEENTFLFNNQRYVMKDGKIYQADGLEAEDIFPLDFTRFSLEHMKQYIQDAILITTEKVGDFIQKTYFLKTSIFEYYYGTKAFESGEITLSVLEGNQIEKIEMDLSSYFGAPCQVVIEYEY